MNVHPFIKQVQLLQQTLSKRLSARLLPPSNQLWLAAKAESRAWIPVQTPEQEASYEDESWLNSTPSSTHLADLDTVASLPAVKVEDRRFTPRIRTVELKPLPQSTDSLRLGNITDPWLPSIRTTPHELPIVPRRSTSQLLPCMRLDEEHSDSPEDRLPVHQLVERNIALFHVEQGRLPHRITIAAIRYWRYCISRDVYDPDTFYYKGIAIPITGAPIGEFGINEVRLD